MGMQDMISSLADNPYFGAGFGLFGLGAATAVLRKVLLLGTVAFRRHCMTTLEVPCRDKSYQWLLMWITERGARNTQHLSVETKFTQIETGKVITKHEFMPSVGEHFFWYGGTWIKVERTREQHTLDLHSGTPWETVKLTTFGRQKQLFQGMLEEGGYGGMWLKVDRTRSEKTVDVYLAVPFETVTVTCLGDQRQMLQSMLHNAKHLALLKTAGKTIMYTAMGSEWRVFGHPRNPRPLHSVVLDLGVTETIVNDVKEFMSSPEWYIDRGIPYRRGYLLHGPPGCGKSSFITALAGHLQLSVCVLNLSERGLTDDRLNHLLAVAPENSIILLEDIDSAFVTREENEKVRSAYEGLTPVTFSGLLNCLDGVASTEARIVFMTTNYPERLDPALIRPGRVDMIQYIGYCSGPQLEKLFLRFYPNQSSLKAKQFAKEIIDLEQPVSAAEIQGHFQQHKDDPHGALKNVYCLSKIHKESPSSKSYSFSGNTTVIGTQQKRTMCTMALCCRSIPVKNLVQPLNIIAQMSVLGKNVALSYFSQNGLSLSSLSEDNFGLLRERISSVR